MENKAGSFHEISRLLKSLNGLIQKNEDSPSGKIRYGKLSPLLLSRLNEFVEDNQVKTSLPQKDLPDVSNEIDPQEAINYKSPKASLENQVGAEKVPVLGERKEILHTSMLKRWTASPFYQELNLRIKNCDSCNSDKIGFFPNYGMGFIDSSLKDMDQFRMDILIIADPPLNFFIKDTLPPTPGACFVSGEKNDNPISGLIGNKQALSAAQRLQGEYPNYVSGASFYFLEEIKRSPFQMEKIMISAIGRCFVTKGKYKELFGGDIAKRPACSDWILEELDYLIKKNRPKSILLFSTHFLRFFMDRAEDLDDLRNEKTLQWKGIPLRLSHHPYRWLKNPGIRKKVRKDLMDLYQLVHPATK